MSLALEHYLNLSSHASPKEVFLAYTDIIGEHFALAGAKYVRSRPRITIADGDVELELGFWSGRFNLAERHVQLEMVASYVFEPMRKEKLGKNGKHGLIWVSSGWLQTGLDLRANIYRQDAAQVADLISRIDKEIVLFCRTLQREQQLRAHIDAFGTDEIVRQESTNCSIRAYLVRTFPQLAAEIAWNATPRGPARDRRTR
ncbi:MAG: hypothetical protein R3E83_05895 [Burkholderiaceae bacterium]